MDECEEDLWFVLGVPMPLDVDLNIALHKRYYKMITMRTSILILGLVAVSVLLIFTHSVAEAQIGYKEVVTVDNTTWSIERSTIHGTLEIEGEVNVTGIVIRDSSFNNFAGISADERTLALPGRMISSEKTLLVSKGGPVVITRAIKGENESANITISEAWPTFLSTTKAVGYSGTQISTDERYENNGEVISTSFNANKLVKVSRYDTNILGMTVSAEIHPGYVKETISINKSTYYELMSTCIGKAYVGYESGGGITKVKSSEYYFGVSKITKSIKTETEVHPVTPAPTPTPPPHLCPFP